MSKNTTNAFLYRISKYYYMDNMSQAEIAKIEGISRSQVAKMLDRARSLGIVRISIALPAESQMDELQNMLAEKFSLRRVLILDIDESNYASIDDIHYINDSATLAASIAAEWISEGTRVGVGWGRSTYCLAKNLQPTREDSGKQFVPMCNGFGQNSKYLQPSLTANAFAEKFGASCFFLNPLIAQLDQKYWAVIDQQLISEAKEVWESLDTAIFSVGSMIKDQNPYYTELLKDELKGETLRSNMCGVINSWAYDKMGKIAPNRVGMSPFSYDISRLTNLQNSICFAQGATKARAIYWAAKHRFFTSLITDVSTARLLLELEEE